MPFVGTASWSNPPTRQIERLSGETHLKHYAKSFSCVEINSSFYRTHRPATYARWASETPASFRFVVKMPRSITHEAHLMGCAQQIARFYREISALGPKLGAVLIQLPPTLDWNRRSAQAFFKALPRRVAVDVVLEPRHPSWFLPAVDDFLKEWDVVRAAADPARCSGADVPGGSNAAAYFRWHGSPRMYYSSYTRKHLAAFAATVQQYAGRRIWCMFDNTARHAAWDNALTLAVLLRTFKSAGSIGAPKLRRVQLKRTRGWRMPANTLKVDRSTRWGNHVAAAAELQGVAAVRAFRRWLKYQATRDWKSAARAVLTGKNLACWCKEGAPCHAEVLLKWLEEQPRDLETALTSSL